MNKKPVISVIIPFYNRLKWLADAVESVFNQSFENFEMILIDDGSTENIENYIDISNPKIRYFRQKNKGSAAARNRGIKMAKGKYIAFLDSDDIFLPNKLEYQLSVMEHNSTAILSHSSYAYMDSGGRRMQEFKSGKFFGKVYPRIVFDCLVATPTVMLRKTALGNLRFEKSLKIGEDVVLWCRIAKKSKIVGIEKVLTLVRRHDHHTALISPNAKVVAWSKIVDCMIRDEHNPLLMLKFFSAKKYLLGKVYFNQGNKDEGLKYIVTSLVVNPLNNLAWQDVQSFVLSPLSKLKRYAKQKMRLKNKKSLT